MWEIVQNKFKRSGKKGCGGVGGEGNLVAVKKMGIIGFFGYFLRQGIVNSGAGVI